MSSTAKKLKKINDPVKFELLASAVLRSTREYSGLIHTGRNVDGKTVKSPVDGIFAVPKSSPPHFVIVHHTTIAPKKLRGKWLSGSRLGKISRRTASDGDIVKAIHWAKEERKKTPGTKISLVLTWNDIPSANLIRDAKRICTRHRISIDVWDCSRLEYFLDINPDGQYIRKIYLGIEQVRLSVDLLKELSVRSCQYYQETLFTQSDDEWIDRNFDRDLCKIIESRQSVTFMVAKSGFGKSTAAYRLLRNHVAGGGFGLWIHPRFLEKSSNIYVVIDAVLRDLHPAVESGSGQKVFELLQTNNTLLLIVDDINRTHSPSTFVEQISSWAKSQMPLKSGEKNEATSLRYQIVCPLWPQVLRQVSEQILESIKKHCLYGGAFSAEEGATYVRKRAELAGCAFTYLQSQEVSESLGHDPLLITLWGATETEISKQATNEVYFAVIDRFVQRQLEVLAEKAMSRYKATEYYNAILALCGYMIEYRHLVPDWDQVVVWFSEDPAKLEMLRDITNHRGVCRAEGTAQFQQLIFRHDRIRDYLLSLAIHQRLVDGEIDEVVIAEPYYAEVIGQALLIGKLDANLPERIIQNNPLALLCAFKLFREPKTLIHEAIVNSIQTWLNNVVAQGQCLEALQQEVERVLCEIDSPLVLKFSSFFLKQSFPLIQARMRNGDVQAGAIFCAEIEPNSSAPWRDVLINHVVERYGQNYIEKLGYLLSQPNLSERMCMGALNLAGHVGSPSLLPAIKKCWDQVDVHTAALLASFIWAGARCSDRNPGFLLDPIFDYWATLPDKEDADEKTSVPSCIEVSEYHLRFAFHREKIVDEVVKYFVARAEDSPLTWPLIRILQEIDHPVSVEFIARQAAQISQKIEGTKNFSFWLVEIRDLWNRDRKEGYQLSEASRIRLQEIWSDRKNNRHFRHQAFNLWARSIGREEIGLLRKIKPSSPLHNEALRKRMILGDMTAHKDVIQRLNADRYPEYWWQFCHYCWTVPLMERLNQHFDRRGHTVTKSWDQNTSNGDAIISRLLTQIPTNDAETLLLRHWSHLRFSADFVQSALFVSTTKCREIAAEAITQCPNPQNLLEHLSIHLGMHEYGREDRFTLRQLESFAPYLDFLGEMTIWDIWKFCNRHGYFDWRRRNIDSRVSKKWRRQFGLTDGDLFEQLDEYVLEKINRFYPDFWLREFIERGDSEDRAMKIIVKWLDERRTVEAFRIAAKCVAQGGTRKNLSMLDMSWLPTDDAKLNQIKKNAYFRVFRRTLK